MIFKQFKLFFLSLLILLGSISKGISQVPKEEGYIELSMRMIGHQVLLSSADSTSRVLAIKKEEGKYRIQFESEFKFNPDDLAKIIDSVMTETGIASSYLAEMEDCESKDVIYSYAIGGSTHSDIIPCRSRNQPKACYNLLISILNADEQIALNQSSPNEEPNTSVLDATKPNSFVQLDTIGKSDESTSDINDSVAPVKSNTINNSDVSAGAFSNENIFILLLLVLLFVGLTYYLKKKKENVTIDPYVVEIGKYQFDKRNMNLSHENNSIELTGKEADLLCLLHDSANTTIERDRILQEVWGDEGDYVGRTLDVFISKLRKKLEADPSLKIANIRGIGYKLVLND